jgi:hypothetical protein
MKEGKVEKSRINEQGEKKEETRRRRVNAVINNQWLQKKEMEEKAR